MDFKKSTPLLRVKNLTKRFKQSQGPWFKKKSALTAIDNVSFEVYAGDLIGIVGESGCGKSTLARSILRLEDVDHGEIYFKDQNFRALRGKALRTTRRFLQMIFQDPSTSLDPRQCLEEILDEPFAIHNLIPPRERPEKIRALLKEVGLSSLSLDQFPHQLSGGQQQRVNIARALALSPELLIADEAVSALDMSVQAQILNLLKDLNEQKQLAVLFISHDLKVIEFTCDKIFVMYKGRIIEEIKKQNLFRSPQHPYTKSLVERTLSPLKEDPFPPPIKSFSDSVAPFTPWQTGCPYRIHCPQRTEKCSTDTPTLQKNEWGGAVACWATSSE